MMTGGMQLTLEGSWLGGRGEQGRMVIVVRTLEGGFYEEIILQLSSIYNQCCEHDYLGEQTVPNATPECQTSGSRSSEPAGPITLHYNEGDGKR